MRQTLALFALCASLAACGDDGGGGKADGGDTTSDTAVGDTTPSDTREASDTRDTAVTGCDPVLNGGCEAGQNCTYIGAETTTTCVAAGPVPATQKCSAEDRCQRGVCMSVNQTDNYCYQVCEEDTDCGAGTANVCLVLNGAPFKVCKIPGIYETCNLLGQTCSDEAKSCYAVGNEDEPICLATGTSAEGAECSTPSACAEGLACVNDVCRKLCDPDVEDSCGETATCRDFFDDTGYCAPN